MTIRINKNQPNNCVFTLNEKTTLSSPIYLMELRSKQDDNHKLLRLSGDTSANKVRYNQFEVTESDVEDLANGVVSLEAGEYTYFIWESESSVLSTDSATSIVESGLVQVIGTGSTSYTYSEKPTEYTVKY